MTYFLGLALFFAGYAFMPAIAVVAHLPEFLPSRVRRCRRGVTNARSGMFVLVLAVFTCGTGGAGGMGSSTSDVSEIGPDILVLGACNG